MKNSIKMIGVLGISIGVGMSMHAYPAIGNEIGSEVGNEDVATMEITEETTEETTEEMTEEMTEETTEETTELLISEAIDEMTEDEETEDEETETEDEEAEALEDEAEELDISIFADFSQDLGYGKLDGHWAKNEVTTLYLKKGINGLDRNNLRVFDIDRAITGVELASAIFTSANMETDPDKDWQTGVTDLAISCNMVSESMLATLNQPIKREEMAYMLINAGKYFGMINNENVAYTGEISDIDTANEAYVNSIKESYSVGLLTGKSDGYAPKDTTTRGEACVIINRLFEYSTRVDNFEILELAKRKIVANNGAMWINGTKMNLENKMIFSKGRLYLESEEIAEYLGIETAINTGILGYEIVTYNNKPYYAVNDIVEQFDMWAVFQNTGVQFYTDYNFLYPDNSSVQKTDMKMGCLRFEDIMADPSENSRFTHTNLEKFRTVGNWLFANNQEFSIAWIPLFINPVLGIENDLLETFNFYNADFIYTMDYLISHGGAIGAHGLSHQSGNEISADGDEFGPNTIFTEAQIRERMTRAMNIASELGYTAEFFEFPHYAITTDQLLIAEELYPVIYQQYPEPPNSVYGKIDLITRNNNSTLYIPTPVDHVYSVYDKNGVIERINKLQDSQLTSLFFQPHLDWHNVSCVTNESGERVLDYSSDGILPSVYKAVTDKGVSFQIPWSR